ncbi:BMP/retinoic acid-inducible neural-specific protein 2 [Apodemus speciosus]|uniref:BMP/retinoic acid-inducible neural-specific protein 2 n=1 Tax=Apodemus speciosus TaxID=105296 RepID=A0ABQ0EEM1_APOSI
MGSPAGTRRARVGAGCLGHGGRCGPGTACLLGWPGSPGLAAHRPRPLPPCAGVC